MIHIYLSYNLDYNYIFNILQENVYSYCGVTASSGFTRTPFCITFDFETVGDENTPADHCVTVRERDTMQQVRMPISEVKAYLREKCAF